MSAIAKLRHWSPPAGKFCHIGRNQNVIHVLRRMPSVCVYKYKATSICVYVNVIQWKFIIFESVRKEHMPLLS